MVSSAPVVASSEVAQCWSCIVGHENRVSVPYCHTHRENFPKFVAVLRHVNLCLWQAFPYENRGLGGSLACLCSTVGWKELV